MWLSWMICDDFILAGTDKRVSVGEVFSSNRCWNYVFEEAVKDDDGMTEMNKCRIQAWQILKRNVEILCHCKGSKRRVLNLYQFCIKNKNAGFKVKEVYGEFEKMLKQMEMENQKMQFCSFVPIWNENCDEPGLLKNGRSLDMHCKDQRERREEEGADVPPHPAADSRARGVRFLLISLALFSLFLSGDAAAADHSRFGLLCCRTFAMHPHPDDKQRARLSRELGLDSRQIKFWFQNRRTLMKASYLPS
ncbi:hypothetical protein ZIOFF_014088 [Zingiber officinale]|uniref:Homeobox domain-containing protein n=1 Tax=Zingiber officinale TaxID=94328 RepID=A0A8J5HB55_ZINOF|nr:hypothetical protein ZIOFF_014088 [Zingiber officinale]